MLGLFQFKNNRNYSQEPSDEVQRHDSFCKVTIFFELLEINLPKNTFLTLNKMYGPFCVKMSHHTPFIEKTSYLSSMKQQVHPYLDGSIPYFSKNRDIKLLTTLKEWLRLKN